MKYIMEDFIKKISAPVICVIDGKENEYENGTVITAALSLSSYGVQSISVRDEKVVLVMTETGKTDNKSKDIRKSKPVVVAYDSDEKWVKEYREQFCEEPSFF